MSRYVSETLRNFVIKRANSRCEYCKIHLENSFFTFHLEHIISIKHGGKTVQENLALACPICNLNKGSDVATFIEDIEVMIRFYNPRIDKWDEHFTLESTGFISSKSIIGNATVKILNLNHPDSIIERREMIRLNLIE